MSNNNDQPLPDIAFHLNQLGETTTAAELVRKKGQSTQLKVISEKKLMNWILALLQQHLAGKADALSDEEKQELVSKAQAEIQKRLKVEQELDKERQHRATELRSAQEKLNHSQKSQSDYEAAIAAYKGQLEQRDKTIEDLQQDNIELQDELSQKIALVRSTLEEKDREREKLQHSLRNQMVRSTGLLEGVIGLDNDYYRAKHQNDHPASEAASPEEQFYHDFDVGAAIIQSLARDLGRLREIAHGTGAKDAGDLLESDLQLLTQIKEGSLASMDVASPVASLVEAVEGARNEAIALEEASALATGLPRHAQPISATPDGDGKPAEVLAGTTTVIRELSAALARERAKLGALKSIADEADSARNAGETELEEMRAAYDGLVQSVTAEAVNAKVAVPKNVNDTTIAPAERAAAAQLIIAELAAHRTSPEVKTLETALATRVRDLGQTVAAARKARGDSAEAVKSRVVDLDKLVARLAQDADSVEQAELLRATQAALDSVQQELADREKAIEIRTIALAKAQEAAGESAQRLEIAEAALAAQRQAQGAIATGLRDLGETIFGENAKGGEQTQSHSAGAARVADLGRSLEADDAAKVAAGAKAVVDALRKDATKHREKTKLAKAEVEKAEAQNRTLHDKADRLAKELAESTARADQLMASERELSKHLIAAAKGDASLADTAADLAVILDDQHASVADLNAHSKLAVQNLARRKQQLDQELARLHSEQETNKTRSFARAKGLEQEIAKLAEESSGLNKQLNETRRQLDAEKARGETDRAEAVETAASAKEIIQHLRSTQETRDAELVALRQADKSNTSELAGLRERAAGAESATKLLADTMQGLSNLAGADQELKPAHQALEKALEAMPGEAGISLPPEAAERIATAARGLLGTLALRRSELIEAEQMQREALAAANADRAEKAKALAANQARIKELEADLQGQAADAVETAATAKEMIQALQGQVAAREAKFKDAHTRDEAAQAALSAARSRLAAADAASRRMAETLAQLASAELKTVPDLGKLEAVEEARVDLELALSEMPSEDDATMQVSTETAQRLAEASHKTGDALANRRKATADDLTKTKRDADILAKKATALEQQVAETQQVVQERDRVLKRTTAELDSVRGELKSQANALAAKTEELSDARSKAAALASQLDDADTRTGAATRELAELRTARAMAEKKVAELEGAPARAAAAEAAVEELTNALGDITKIEDREAAGIIAGPGSVLVKATGRLSARDRAPAQAASAGTQFIRNVRDQLTDLGREVAHGRKHQEELTANAAHLQSELSHARTSVVAREQELTAARQEADDTSRRAAAAEAALRELAGAVTIAAGDQPAVKPLADAGTDVTRLVTPAAVQAAVQAAHSAANAAATTRSERDRLAAEAADLQTEISQLRSAVTKNAAEASERTREADEARAAERAVGAAATELGRDLLAAAKAAASDVDPESSRRAGEILEGYDRLSAERRVAAAAGFMPNLRELFTNLAISVAETRATMEATKERHITEATTLRSDLDRSRAEAGRLLEAQAAQQLQQAEAQKAMDALRGDLDDGKRRAEVLEQRLLETNAELDEWRARGEASTGSAGAESSELKQRLATERSRLADAEAELAKLREKLAATEARLAKGREDLAHRLAERDEQIAIKTRELDELANQHADTQALQAKMDALTKDLAQAHEQLSRYKQTHGDLTGANAQAGDLKKTLKGAEAERQTMRAKIRDLEAELSDRNGALEEAQTALAAKQGEMQALRDRKDQELEAERTAIASTKERERKLTEENVGLKARVRRLTEK